MWEAAKRAGRVVEERDGRRTTRSSTQHHTEHPDISLCSRPLGACARSASVSAERSRPWHARIRGASASEARPRPRHVRVRGTSASEARPRPRRVRVRSYFGASASEPRPRPLASASEPRPRPLASAALDVRVHWDVHPDVRWASASMTIFILWRFVTNSARGRPAIALSRHSSAGLLRVPWLALMESLVLTGRHGPQTRLALASLASIVG